MEILEASLSLVWDNFLSKASQIADVGSEYDGAVPLMSHKPKTEGRKTAHRSNAELQPQNLQHKTQYSTYLSYRTKHLIDGTR